MLKFNIQYSWNTKAFFKIRSCWVNLHTVPTRCGTGKSTLVPAFFFFFVYEDIMICEWKIKSSPRENMCIKKTKVKTQLKSLSLGSLSCLPQAAWVPSPLNFTSTFSDSDLFPRPKFLTPGWTNTNVLRITELNVWYAGCLINLSRIIILCRVVSACPKAYSLGRLRDTNKGYMGKSLWIG